ncbi:MAG: adenosylcobinamide-phosphate synthase CbiB [Halofilum sp. (in: g-proteobacteria)]|nr:adenosylcobinamide-phosphate synthase CbiB [Halofilum sp. (in: g-proteobacteria)]
MSAGLVIAAALAADWLFGEIRHGHPLAGFGRLAGRVERQWNRRALPAAARRALGIVAVVLLVVPLAVAAGWISARAPYGSVLEVAILYLALGLKSLGEHAHRVQQALAEDELDAARTAVGAMVSRDTRYLGPRGAAAAAVESVLENGSDAVLAALFWFLVAGVPGVVAHRLVNTLDAMWGYRTQRLSAFGWAAARLDDVLNWIPARLVALTYALVSGHPRRALACAWRQGGRTASPNAGVVMAAGAGALGVQLGGPGVYHGRRLWRPRFGVGAGPTPAAIGRSIRLVQGGALVWTAAALLLGLALA